MRSPLKARELAIAAVVIALLLAGLAEIWNQARCRMLDLRIRLDQQSIQRHESELATVNDRIKSGDAYIKEDRADLSHNRVMPPPQSWADERKNLEEIIAGYREFVTRNSAELAEIKRSLLFP